MCWLISPLASSIHKTSTIPSINGWGALVRVTEATVFFGWRSYAPEIRRNRLNSRSCFTTIQTQGLFVLLSLLIRVPQGRHHCGAVLVCADARCRECPCPIKRIQLALQSRLMNVRHRRHKWCIASEVANMAYLPRNPAICALDLNKHILSGKLSCRCSYIVPSSARYTHLRLSGNAMVPVSLRPFLGSATYHVVIVNFETSRISYSSEV